MGFPNRMIYENFHKRYFVLDSNVPSRGIDSKLATKKILETLIAKQIHETENIQYRISKIFFRVGAIAKIEEARELFLASLIPIIQACARGYVGRKIYQQKRDRAYAAEQIQEAIREWQELREWSWFRLFINVRHSLKIYSCDLEISKIKLQTEKIQKEIEIQEEERKKAEDEILDLEDELADSKIVLKKQQTDYDELKEDLEDQEMEIRELNKKIFDKEDALGKVTNQWKALDKERGILESDLEEVQFTGGDFTQILERMESS